MYFVIIFAVTVLIKVLVNNPGVAAVIMPYGLRWLQSTMYITEFPLWHIVIWLTLPTVLNIRILNSLIADSLYRARTFHKSFSLGWQKRWSWKTLKISNPTTGEWWLHSDSCFAFWNNEEPSVWDPAHDCSLSNTCNSLQTKILFFASNNEWQRVVCNIYNTLSELASMHVD